MTTDTQLNDTGDIDSLSPAELAYFESKGTKTDGLFPAAEPEKVAETTPQPAPAPDKAEGKTPDEMEPGEIRIDAEGRAHNAKGRYVPHQALHSERERRKIAERERDELSKKFQEWVSINARSPQTQDATPPAKTDPEKKAQTEFVDPEQDIFTFLKQVKDTLTGTQGEIAKIRETDTVRQTEAQLANRFRDDAVRFTREKAPDFVAAYEFLEKSRRDELTNVYGITDEKEIEADIKEQARAIVQAAMARGKSPAETLYSLAQTRGYVKPAAKTSAPASSEGGKTPAQETVERIAEGQTKGITLSGMGGSPTPGLTVDQFLAMDEAEIAEYSRTPKGKAEIQKLLGAR